MASQPLPCSATTWGTPTAPKFAVLIHGLAASSHTWIDVAPELAKNGYYVVAPDLLGHGMAPRNVSYSMDDLAANILAQVADRHIDLLVGHSLGGPVSLSLYPRLREKPKRMILVDPALEIHEERREPVKLALVNEIQAKRVPTEYQKSFPTWTPNASIVKSLAIALVSTHAVEWICDNTRPWSFTKYLPPAGNGLEILIIGANPMKEPVFTLEAAEALAQSRPDIKCIVAAEAGHDVQREQPELIVRAALDSFDSL